MIYFDSSKAFNASHDILTCKLGMYGLDDNNIRKMHNCLTNYDQRIVIPNLISN